MERTNIKLKLAEYYLFIEWLATPDYHKREGNLPTNQAEFAEQFGLRDATLSNWKKDPDFKEDIKRACMKWASDKTANVNMGIYAKAVKGDPVAAKLWYEIFEGFSSKTKVDHTGEIIQTVNIEIKQEKKIQILAAFENFGIIPKQNESNSNSNTSTNNDQGSGQRLDNGPTGTPNSVGQPAGF